MIPIILAIGVVVLIFGIPKVMKYQPQMPNPTPKVGSYTGRVIHPEGPRSYLVPIVKMARVGIVPDHLLNNAFEEAYRRKDWPVVGWLTENFHDCGPIDDDEGEVVEPEPELEPEISDTPTEVVTAETKSPLDGVANDDWSEFISKLRTREAGWSGDRHIGQYEQNRGRLRSLGIPEPTTPEGEYDALAADLAAYAQSHRKLITDWAGDVVVIGDVECPVTQSGVLGLLKAAGPKGATEWLNNPADRAKFPRTTETFVRTNGCF